MDRFRTAIGVLALAWYTHWALTAPIPSTRQPKHVSGKYAAPVPAMTPCAPCLIGAWHMTWNDIGCECELAANGDWCNDWYGVRWEGRWGSEIRPDGSSTLWVDESYTGGGTIGWEVELLPGQRTGKLTNGGGVFKLEFRK